MHLRNFKPPDGANIIFTSDKSGTWQIWQIPTRGGTASQVTKHGGFSAQYDAQSALRNNGVYYFNHQIGRAQVFFHDWQTGKAKMLHEMPHSGFTFEVSKDGQNILVTRDDNRASDIVLIE